MKWFNIDHVIFVWKERHTNNIMCLVKSTSNYKTNVQRWCHCQFWEIWYFLRFPFDPIVITRRCHCYATTDVNIRSCFVFQNLWKYGVKQLDYRRSRQCNVYLLILTCRGLFYIWIAYFITLLYIRPQLNVPVLICFFIFTIIIQLTFINLHRCTNCVGGW